jgi:hypothetical protein
MRLGTLGTLGTYAYSLAQVHTELVPSFLLVGTQVGIINVPFLLGRPECPDRPERGNQFRHLARLPQELKLGRLAVIIHPTPGSLVTNLRAVAALHKARRVKTWKTSDLLVPNSVSAVR